MVAWLVARVIWRWLASSYEDGERICKNQRQKLDLDRSIVVVMRKSAALIPTCTSVR